MSSTTDQALQRLERSTTAIWLVQCNPRTTDILAGSRAAMPASWCVKRHTNEIGRGDRIVLWLSGANAGVYALGEVTAEVQASKVPVDLFLDVFDRPVRRALLKTDPRFAGEPIVRQPFAANPHRVSAPAFAAILERVRSAST